MNVGKLRQIGLDLLRAKMLEEKFDDNSAAGFWIDRANEREIAGRYIEKHATQEVVTDPFGRELRFDRVFYVEQEFELRLAAPNLILRNASSVSKRMIGRLSELSDFRLVLLPIEYSAIDLAEELGRRLEQVSAYAISFDEFSIAPEVVVKLSFRGSADVRGDARRFIGPRKVEPAAIKLQFTFADAVRRCEVRSNGAVQLYGDYEPELLPIILRAIRDCASTGAG
jgi:hypothetical protein